MTGFFGSDRGCRTMTFASYLQQHAQACLKLSETVADEHLADRMKAMAADLLQKAREAEDDNPNDWTTMTPYMA